MNPAEFSTTIVATNPEETAQFYIRHFGLIETSNIGWFISIRRPDATWELCMMQHGHPATPEQAAPAVGGAFLAFVTDDARTLAEKLECAGAPIVAPLKDEPWGQRHFYAQDPAGTLIDVVEFIDPDPEWMQEHDL